MGKDEIQQAIDKIDAMSERCDYVISRNRPLALDIPPKRRAKANPTVMPRFEERPAIACGPLAGNEMRISNGYKPRPREDDCCDPDGMWTAFEAEFDEMVKGMH